MVGAGAAELPLPKLVITNVIEQGRYNVIKN